MPQFTVSKFEGLIQRRGKNLTWERARRCPCFDPLTGQIPENCTICNSDGYLYTLMGSYRATVLGITGNKQAARFGEWVQGDCVMTFSSSMLVGDLDRITLTDAVYRESAVLVKGTKDTLPEPTAFSVLECSDETRSYVPGQDFDLVGATIVWKGLQPAEGATFSLLYTARPVYVVWKTFPQTRALVPTVQPDGSQTLAEMPRKVQLRRWVDWKTV